MWERWSGAVVGAVLLVIGVRPPNAQGAPECPPKQVYHSGCSIGGNITLITSYGLTLTADDCNDHIPRHNLTVQPKIFYYDAEPDKTYTLVEVDRDAPFNPRGYYFLKWILANINGDDFRKGDLSKATVLSIYRAPTPSRRNLYNRYMFLIFRHLYAEYKISAPVKDEDRRTFDLADWLKKYQQVVDCLPIAATQFRTSPIFAIF